MYNNLNQMIEQSQEWDTRKFDLHCQMKDLVIHQNHIEIVGENYRWENVKKQSIGYGRKDFEFPNEFSFKQLMGLMRANDAEIKNSTQLYNWLNGNSDDISFHTRNLLNSFLQDNPDKKLLVRFFDNSPRAILSGQYSDYPNTDLLIGLATKLQSGGVNEYFLPRPYLSPDKVICTVVSKTGAYVKEGDESEPYGGGFGFSNDETGISALKMGGVLWRHKCLNSIRFSSQDRIIHKRHRLISILEKLNTEVKFAFEEIGNWFETVSKASQIEIGDLSKSLNNLEKDYPVFEFSNKAHGQSYRDLFIQGMEGKNSLMAFFNGGSSLAHKIESPETTLEMELAIGNLFQKVQHGEEIKVTR